MAKRVLVADDDPVIIKLVEVNLHMEGYEVITASDGSEAVKKALESPPDLILLDVMMPGVTGWEARQELLEHPETADIPVIFLSAWTQRSDMQRYERTVAHYITKPFDPTVLVEKIESVIGGSPSGSG